MSDSDWVKVFQGPLPEAHVLRTKLESHDIPAFIPDENTHVVDPFVRGGAVFDVGLQVPAEHRERAMEILAGEDDAEPLPPEVAEAFEKSTDPVDLAREKLGGVARRIAFASILMVTAPIALWTALTEYYPTVKRLGIRPMNHRMVLGYTVFSAFLTLVGLGLAGSLLLAYLA